MSLLSCQRLAVDRAGCILIDAVDFCLQPGEVLHILGTNGCGKSTLLLQLAGLQPPLAGRLLLAGQPCWLLDEPTEGLDAPTARDVLQRLHARSAGITLVLCTHLQREAQLADRLVWLEAGVVQAQARKGEPMFDVLLQRLRPD